MKRLSLWLSLLSLLLIGLPVKGTAQTNEISVRLNSPNPAERLKAVCEIARGQVSESLPLLTRAAADPDEDVRERAIYSLGLSGNPQAVETVRRALTDRNEFVRWRAVKALTKLKAWKSLEDITSLAGDDSWRVKVSLCEFLGIVDLEKIELKSTETPRERGLSEKTGQVLLRCLQDPDERVRLAAAAALAGYKNPSAYEPLVGLLKNGSMLIRSEAGVALGVLGEPAAIPLLVEAIYDPRNRAESDGSDFARWGAVKGLVQIAGRDFGADLASEAAGREPDGFERRRALASLSKLKELDAPADPAGIFKERSPQVKLAVFKLEGTIDRKILEPYLQQSCEDPDERVRQAALAALRTR